MANDNKSYICNNWYFGKMAKAPMMTATKADDKGLGSLKGQQCTAAMGAQADNYTKTTKAIAKCVGQVCGNEMQQLVLSGTGSTPAEPTYPDDMNATNKDKAIWSKQCDLFLKQEVQYKGPEGKGIYHCPWPM